MDEKQMRAAYAVAKKMAAEAENDDEKKMHEAYAAKLCAMAEKAGINLDEEPAPPSEKKEAQAAKTAGAEEPPAEKKPATEESEAKPAAASKVASKPLTLADVDAYLADRDERARLIEANKDRIPAGHVSMLASKETSLSQLRNYIAGLPARKAPEGTTNPGGPIPSRNQEKKGMLPMNPREEFAVDHLRKRLGLTEANITASAKVIEKSAEVMSGFSMNPLDGAYAISVVDLAEQKKAERLARKSA
jgi:hypothetical protein